MNQPDYSPAIRSRLDDRDLNALVAALRSPADAGLRAQAARALGEMGDIDGTESLIRSLLEDPDTAVQAAARQALTQMHGSRSELIIASYRNGPPEIDEWLVAPEDEDFPPAARGDGSLTDADIDGLLLVVSQESNPVIREKAIRALEHISDTRSTDMLVYLFLHSAESSTRSAARDVLQAHFGDKAAEIIQAANTNPEDDEEWSDEEDDDPLSEVEYESGEDDGDEENDLEEEEFEPAGDWGGVSPMRPPSDFTQGPSMSRREQGSPVVQEIGIPWRILVVVGIAILILAAILLLYP